VVVTAGIRGTRDDVLWLAGLVEGEGCIDAHRGRYPRLRIGMTDRDVIGRAASLMGSRVRLALHPAPASPTWHTEISGERAAPILRELLPHMGARRSAKIAEVLAVHHYRTAKAGQTSTPGPRITRPPGLAMTDPEAAP
jgi:hypothetical protein